jgi:hypothetical protein
MNSLFEVKVELDFVNLHVKLAVALNLLRQ